MKVAFFLLLFLVCQGFCEFGKNKVRYKKFCWRVLQTENFEVYHEERIEEVAKIAAAFAEEAFKRLKQDFKSAPPTPVILILYGSGADFEQTNVVLQPLEEWVGGFAELLKLRIVVPFLGSYALLKKTIAHELTHIFCFSILYKDIPPLLLPQHLLRTPAPFWLLEGLAEYESGPPSAREWTVLQDAVLEGSLLPISLLKNLFSIPAGRLTLAYEQSRSFTEYLTRVYGKDKLILLLKNIRRGKDVEEAVSSIFGKSLGRLEREWTLWLKRRHYPSLAAASLPEEFATPFKIGGDCTNPVFSKTGDFFAYIQNDGLKPQIYFARTVDGKLLHSVTEGMYKKVFESINMHGRPLSFSEDGDYLLFSARRKGKDIIVQHDIPAKRCVKTIVPSLDFFHSPLALEEERWIVAGGRDGVCGIYKVEEDGGAHLLFEGNILSLSLQEGVILCVKEEGKGTSLLLLDKESFSITPTLTLPSKILAPTFLEKDSLLFSSNIEGIFNIYEYNLKERKLWRITDSCKGILSIDAREGKIIFSAYDGGRFKLFSLKDWEKRDVALKKYEARPLSVAIKDWKVRDYKRKFTPDWMGVNLHYSSFFGTSLLAQIALSDVMGDHRIMLFTDYLSPAYLPYLDFQLLYYYLGARPNLGAGILNWTDFYISQTKKYRERFSGAFLYFDYPFDKYTRVETLLSLLRKEKHFIYPEKEDESKMQNLLSFFFVKDTATLSAFGAVDGQRMRVGVEKAFKLKSEDLSFMNYLFDIRRYKRIGAESCLAFRLLLLGSSGEDKEEFFLGAPTRWRGDEEHEKLWASKIALASIELRTPFVKEIHFLHFGAKRIRAVFFTDAGYCWNREEGERVKLCFGTGIRFWLHLFYARMDLAWTLKEERVSGPILHFILGPDF